MSNIQVQIGVRGQRYEGWNSIWTQQEDAVSLIFKVLPDCTPVLGAVRKARSLCAESFLRGESESKSVSHSVMFDSLSDSLQPHGL